MKPVLLTVLVLMASQSVFSQAPSQFCRQPMSEKVVLEIGVSGRGMIWPSLITQVFFRMFENGVVEYDSRNGRFIVRKQFKLKSEEVVALIGILDQDDLGDARGEYPMLESMRDAVLKTCVSYRKTETERKILLINYQPKHPRAESYYPKSLVRLLSKITELRPTTKFERQYGGGEAGLP